ncbi:HIT-like domain-containing protein [Lipomyces oligophaga]|uniref:HIT-like domain-containing protein n=1 Tax=Lipomyces oligophaga TaxID=45792 RepID=UPI0034CD2A43
MRDEINLHDKDAGPCPFCEIAECVPAGDPVGDSTNYHFEGPSYRSSKTAASTTSKNPKCSSDRITACFEAYNVVLSTPSHVVILDYQPLVSAAAHLLLFPRSHVETAAEYANRPSSVQNSRELTDIGPLFSILAAALGNVFGLHNLNIVSNNGPAAGQTVPHLHFHIVVRNSETSANDPNYSQFFIPTNNAGSRRTKALYQSVLYGRGPRTDLDLSQAKHLCSQLHSYLHSHYWLSRARI